MIVAHNLGMLPNNKAIRAIADYFRKASTWPGINVLRFVIIAGRIATVYFQKDKSRCAALVWAAERIARERSTGWMQWTNGDRPMQKHDLVLRRS